MLTFLKLYALCSLLFCTGWSIIGYRLRARRESVLEPLPEVIRAKDLIL